MGTKVFISSTIRDLHYVRENIGNLLREIGHEAVLSEELNFNYSHGNSFQSCLDAIESSQIYILIIGDKYGTMTHTGRSITHEEFIHACNLNKQMYIFIEGNTWSSANNKRARKGLDKGLAEFVDEVKGDWRFVRDFHKIEEVKHFIKGQLSHLLNDYIQTGEKPKTITKLKNENNNLNGNLGFLQAILKLSKFVSLEDYNRVITYFGSSFKSGVLQDPRNKPIVTISKPKGISLFKANVLDKKLKMIGYTGDINPERNEFEFDDPDSFVSVTYQQKSTGKLFYDLEAWSNTEEIVVCYKLQSNYVLAIHLEIETRSVQVESQGQRETYDKLIVTETFKLNKPIFEYLNLYLKNTKDGESS